MSSGPSKGYGRGNTYGALYILYGILGGGLRMSSAGADSGEEDTGRWYRCSFQPRTMVTWVYCVWTNRGRQSWVEKAALDNYHKQQRQNQIFCDGGRQE